MSKIETEYQGLSTFVANVLKIFTKNFHTQILGRREGFVNPKQMLEDERSEDFSFTFRPMNRTGYKIFILVSWLLKDEELYGFYLKDFLEKTLSQKHMLIDKGESEFLPYLISKSSAIKAFEEEFEGKHRKIFGILNSQNSKTKEFTFPIVFIRVKKKIKSKIPKYTGYCRGYKSSSPAKKDAGESLRKEIEQHWNRKRIIYNILFRLLPNIDLALFNAGFTDNYQQVQQLLVYKQKLEDELQTL